MPPHTPADLPSADLVDAVTPHRFSRFTVGTGPFNAMAMVVLLGISAFVVMASSEVSPLQPSSAGADEVATVPRPAGSPPGSLAFADDATTTTSTTTTEAPTTTSTAPPTTTTAAPKKSTANRTASSQAKLVVRPVRCSDFPDQPASQKWFDSNRASFAGLDGDGDGTACEDLPGAPKASAPAAIRALSKADLLRPNTRLYGVHTPQAPLASEIDAFAAEAGKSPNMVMFFRDFDDPFPAEAVSASWAGGRLPMVSLEPILKDSTDGQPKLRDIYTGKFDAFLTTWAQAAAAQNLAFVLRFGQEMNGNWYSWSDGVLGNARGDYVKAWRHVHDLFAANGADDIIWNWSVNRVDSLSDKTLARFYPGDSYVDWVGVSGYLRSVGSTPPSFDTTFAQTLAELKRVAPSKLVVLTEVGAGTTEANRVAWINDLFAKLLQHPEIIGFNWFNDFKSGGDWRIGYSTQTEAAFRTGVADARYGPLVP